MSAVMSKHLLISIISSIAFILVGVYTPAGAQADRASISVSEDNIHQSVASRLRLNPNAVNVAFAGNVVNVSITIASGKRHRQEYTNEASVVEVAVLKEIANKQAYKNVHTIRVQYLMQSGSSRPVVLRTVDFRRGPHGMFEKHSS